MTTERNKRQQPAPDFVIKYMNQFWVVGWALGVQMTVDLVIMALHTRLLDPSFSTPTGTASTPAQPLETDAGKWEYVFRWAP